MINNNDYMNIRELAAACDVSVQYIYQELRNKKSKLNNYLKVIDNKKMIDKSAITEFFKKDIKQEFKQELNKTLNNNDNELIELIKSQLQEKDRQLAEKDKQLQEKDKQIAELIKLQDQQQQLTLNQQQLLITGTEEETSSKAKKKWWQR